MPKFEQYSAHVKCDGRKLTEYEYADETDSDEIEEVDPGERISKKDKGKGRATEQHEHEHKANERNEDEEMENATQVEESEEMEEEKKSSPYDNPKDDKIVWIESKTGKVRFSYSNRQISIELIFVDFHILRLSRLPEAFQDAVQVTL